MFGWTTWGANRDDSNNDIQWYKHYTGTIIGLPDTNEDHWMTLVQIRLPGVNGAAPPAPPAPVDSAP